MSRGDLGTNARRASAILTVMLRLLLVVSLPLLFAEWRKPFLTGEKQ